VVCSNVLTPAVLGDYLTAIMLRDTVTEIFTCLQSCSGISMFGKNDRFSCQTQIINTQCGDNIIEQQYFDYLHFVIDWFGVNTSS